MKRTGFGSTLELLVVVALGGLVTVLILRACVGLLSFGMGAMEALRASEQEQEQTLELILDKP